MSCFLLILTTAALQGPRCSCRQHPPRGSTAGHRGGDTPPGRVQLTSPCTRSTMSSCALQPAGRLGFSTRRPSASKRTSFWRLPAARCGALCTQWAAAAPTACCLAFSPHSMRTVAARLLRWVPLWLFHVQCSAVTQITEQPARRLASQTSCCKAASTMCTGARGLEQRCSEAVPCMPAAAGRGGSEVHRGCAGGAAPRTGTSHPHGMPTVFPMGRRLTASSPTPVSCPHTSCRLHVHTPAVCATRRTWRRPRRQEYQTPVRHWTLGVLR